MAVGIIVLNVEAHMLSNRASDVDVGVNVASRQCV